MNRTACIYVAGHRGLVGSAIMRRLHEAGYERLLTRDRTQLDLEDAHAVEAFFAREKPAYVFLAAARVGGIHANDAYPADFIRENIQIQTNVITSAHRHGTRKLVFLGSSCIYPRLAPQPISESALLTGPLEPTNEGYAIAKIAGIAMCQAYRKQYGFNAICLMPTNLYGPGDNFDVDNSHVLAALIRRFDDARERGDERAIVWGTGTPRREFLHVDDMADACVFLMCHYDDAQPINVGWGKDISIRELAEMVKAAVGYQGRLEFDHTRPDGVPRKLLDVSRCRSLGWEPRISLEAGIAATVQWFRAHRGRDVRRRG